MSRSYLSLLEKFLALKSDLSPHTVAVYRRWLPQLPDEIDSDSILAFLTDLRKKKTSSGKLLSDSTRSQAYRTMRSYTNWLLLIGHLKVDPLLGYTAPLPRVPSKDDVKLLLDACRKRTDDLGLRNHAVVLTLADSGVRASELCGLLIEHLDREERSLLITQGKGKKDRKTFISDVTLITIDAYLKV